MTKKTPLRTAIAGIGGFAAQHHTCILELEDAGETKLVATCDPRAAQLVAEEGERFCFEKRGVAVYEDFDELMGKHGEALDLLTVSSPIRFHAPMHRAAVERRIPCYLEKPPTLDPAELEEMIALDATAVAPTQVGFNYIYQPFRKALIDRIRSGEFGKLKRLLLHLQWPRDLQYYGRNNWAGGLMLGDYILLDSCCGNAASHHLQNILAFAGEDYPLPLDVESELYRANAINGTDTIFSRGTLQNGVEFRIAATHATNPEERIFTEEMIECENATIELQPSILQGKIVYRDGRVESLEVPRANLADNLALYTGIARGNGKKPAVTLPECRAFVALNALFYVAAGKITPVQAPYSGQEMLLRNNLPMQVIHGIGDVCRTMIKTGALPSEQGLPWAVPGGKAHISQLGTLREVLTGMLS